jgi:hypothetical protein
MQGRVFPVVAFVDDDIRLADDVQQTPEGRRVGNGVEAGKALGVDKTRVGTTLDEQMDDVHETLTSGPLQGCGEVLSPDPIDFRALVEEVSACIGFAKPGGPV